MSKIVIQNLEGIAATIGQVNLSAGHVLDNKGTIDLSRNSGAFQLPVGNTAQRPSNPEAGYVRYNTDNNAEGSEIGVEYWDGWTWYAYGEFTERQGASSEDAVSYSAYFDGQWNYLTAYSAALGWVHSSDSVWTVEFWMKDDGTTDQNCGLLEFWESSTNVMMSHIKRQNNDLVWSYQSGAGLHLQASGAWTTLGDGEWHHVAICSYDDGSDGDTDWRMFIDGTSVAFKSFGFTASNDFGNRLNIGGSLNYFKGWISNVRLTEDALYPSSSLTVPISSLTTTSQGASTATVELLMLSLNAVSPTVATRAPGAIITAGNGLVEAQTENPFGAAGGGASPPGEVVFHASGPNTSTMHNWTVPDGVTNISVLSIGGGGGGESNHDGAGGAGGSLSYKNNITVTPGDSVTVYVGGGGMANGWGQYGPDGSNSYVNIAGVQYAVAGGGTGGKGNYGSSCWNIPGGYYSNGDGGGEGGASSHYSGCRQAGGGAGGYNGGGQTNSGRVSNPQYSGCNGNNGQNGGGGGGSSANGSSSHYCGGGGGTGIYGQGPNGIRGNNGQNSYPNNETHFCGKGGSTAHNTGLRGYSNRSNNSTFEGSGSGYNRYHPSYNGNSSYTCPDGGFPGGGGGGANSGDAQGQGGHGVVRIIWGDDSFTRSFPTTNVDKSDVIDGSYTVTTEGNQLMY